MDMDMDHTTTTISTDDNKDDNKDDNDDDKDDVVTTKLLLVIFTIPQGMFVDLDDPLEGVRKDIYTTTNCIPPRSVIWNNLPAFGAKIIRTTLLPTKGRYLHP
jgi:hypothetical protein